MAHHWEQRPDYVNACSWQAPLGVPSVYHPPRPVGRGSSTDVTDYHHGQSHWSEDDLPEVMYMLKPDDDWEDLRMCGRASVSQMVDRVTGELHFEKWPRPWTTRRPLLDFPILRGINKIGTEEHWWWFEAIRRLDPRIAYYDLTMRMEYTGLRSLYNDKQFVDRVFNNRASRTMRPAWRMLNWHGKLQGNSKKETSTWNKLSTDHIQNNTTRGLTPGLTNPNLPEGPHNIRVPVPDKKQQTAGKLIGLRVFKSAKSTQLPAKAKKERPLSAKNAASKVSFKTSPTRKNESRASAGRPGSTRVARTRRQKQEEPDSDDDAPGSPNSESEIPWHHDTVPSGYLADDADEESRGLPTLRSSNIFITDPHSFMAPYDLQTSHKLRSNHESSLTTWSSRTGYRMGSHHTSYTSTFLSAHVPLTSLPPTQSLFSAVRSFDADLKQVSTCDRDPSPNTCRHREQYYPEILRTRHDCPTYDEPPAGHLWHVGYPASVENQHPTSRRELWNDQTAFLDDTREGYSDRLHTGLHNSANLYTQHEPSQWYAPLYEDPEFGYNHLDFEDTDVSDGVREAVDNKYRS